ncbi:MAG: hypothetical protein QOE70_1960 [Chthoniobacter sp.]|nr:hypothetical protein [Chthoniobacter sp.]
MLPLKSRFPFPKVNGEARKKERGNGACRLGRLRKTNPMNSFFAELGRTVLARWKAQNFSLARFPEIAQGVLEERPPAKNVDLSPLVKEFLLNDEQPFQTQSGFGQPELVVHDDPRFYIQILFWLEGTTDIHQHKFSGAFHVLEGSSIHSRFDFENAESVSAHLRVGHLRMKDTRLLETGSTVPIVSGGGYIHSLFHLDTPSLSVVIRTHTDPGTGPQFTYLPPHLAVDPFYHDALTNRRKQLLDVLEKTEDPTYPALVLEMIEDLDFERGFFILQNGMGYLRTLDRWEETLHTFQQKHGRLAGFVAPTLDEIIRRDTLAELRGSIAEVEHRFFLALLLNVPHRDDILSLVAQRFPGPPVDTILRWVEELGVTSDSGTWILDAEFPEELAIPMEKQSEVFLATLRHCLEDRPAAVLFPTLSLSAIDTQRLRDTLTRSSLKALVS